MDRPRILAHLRGKIEAVDLIARGIWGFSFLHTPHMPLYTRLHLPCDYDPDACRSAEAWFQESALPAFEHAMVEACQAYEVRGTYRMDTITVY